MYWAEACCAADAHLEAQSPLPSRREAEKGLKKREKSDGFHAAHRTYLPLQLADQQSLQNLPRLIAVSHVLECLRCILAAYIEEDFLAAAGKR